MATTINFQPIATGSTGSNGNRLGSIDPRLSRTNYFDGQLLKASDLTRDQIYLDERLLEVGQAFGSGIAQGLELTLGGNQVLEVQPGLAIAPSGRVLQLSGRTLRVDLLDGARVATLNQGAVRRLPRGLYAVALQHAEVVSGVAEAYPADLASRRQLRVSAYAEGVELVLVPLPVPLPRGDGKALRNGPTARAGLAARAALARELVQASGRLALPSDDAVALGLLAMETDSPAWLDLGLLRRPLRPALSPDAGHLDLAAHYRELYRDVLDLRSHTGQHGGWAASQYFRVLPAFGPLPKNAIDPVAGSQFFFPKDYEVSIAPVRQSDLATVLAECERLSPIDLDKDKDVDVMVLVPLADAQFALRARQLEAPAAAGSAASKTGLLARIDVLALRLFALPPVHAIDTDVDVWKPIWDAVADEDLVYVRRPPRTAETNVSAVVLARGFGVPAAETAATVDLEALEQQLDAALVVADNAQAEVRRLEADAAQLRATVARLEAEVARGDGSPLNDALERIRELQVELVAAEARITELQSGERNAAILATAIAAATDKIDAQAATITGQASEIASQAAQLNTQATALASQQTDLANRQAEIAALRAEIDSLNAQLADLVAQLAAALATGGDLAAAQAALADASAKLAASQAETQSAREALALSQDEVARLQAELASLKAQLAGLANEAAALKTEAAAQADEAARQRAAAAAQAAEAAAQKARADQALADLAQTQADLDAARKALAAAQAQPPGTPPVATLSLIDLAVMRGNKPVVAEVLEKQVSRLPAARPAVVQILALVDRSMDSVLWPTLTEVGATPDRLPSLLEGLVKLLGVQAGVPDAFLELGPFFGLSGQLLEGWKALVV
jgi:hypothetical protein